MPSKGPLAISPSLLGMLFGIILVALAAVASVAMPEPGSLPPTPPAKAASAPAQAMGATTVLPAATATATTLPTPSVIATLTPTAVPPTATPMTPTPTVGAVPTATPAVKVYVVQAGDTLFDIAARFGVEVESIAQANGLRDADSLALGQKLIIPSSSASTPAPGTTPAAAQPQPRVYVVEPGDTLLGIAEKFGVTAEAISRANGLPDPGALSPGQELIIPSTPQ